MISTKIFVPGQKFPKNSRLLKPNVCKTHFKLSSHNVIYARVRINSKEAADKSTGIKVEPGTFCRKTKTIQNDPDNTALLALIETTVYQIFKDREITGRSLDPTIIRDIAFGLRDHDDHKPTVIDALKLHMTYKEQQFKNKDIVFRSFQRYKAFTDVLSHFFYHQPGYGRNTQFSDLKPALRLHLMDEYLKGKKEFGHNYALKIFQFFRGVIDYAIAHEWADRNPLQHIKIGKERKDVLTLNMDELELLKRFHSTDPQLNQVRDVFLFMIYTGLAYSDVATLSESHLTTIKEVPSLLKKRVKSGVQAFVPLFPQAQQILDRYRADEAYINKGKLLPVLPNAKMNERLKVLGNQVGIKKTLHTHLGRKTFTMYTEQLGFSLDEMAVMMGHSRASMTEAFYHQRRQEPVITKFKTLFADLQLHPQLN